MACVKIAPSSINNERVYYIVTNPCGDDKYNHNGYRGTYGPRMIRFSYNNGTPNFGSIELLRKIEDILNKKGEQQQDKTYKLTSEVYDNELFKLIENMPVSAGGSRRARRPSRKYKKSAKRVFRKKSRSTRRR